MRGKCYRCKKVKSNVRVNKTSYRILKRPPFAGQVKKYLSYLCRNCSRIIDKRYYDSEKGQACYRKKASAYIKRNPEKKMAHRILNYYVRQKYIKRPNRCSSCRKIARIHGHHEDYKKPLEVIWLCSFCHIARHKLLSTGTL